MANMKANWGIKDGAGVENVISGVCTDFEIQHEPNMEYQHNEVGAVIQAAHYDDHFQVSATVEVPAGSALPKPGATFTVASKQYFVTSASVIENNMAYRRVQVTAESYPNCTTLTDYTASNAS